MRIRENLFIVPVGTTESKLLQEIAHFMQTYLHTQTKIGKGIPVPPDAYNHHRRQYISTVIMDQLKASKKENVTVVGVVDADIYAPPLQFVFGKADPQSGVAVISLQRLREEFYGRPSHPRLFAQRAMKEALHETGHLLRLDHCSDPLCIMHFSNRMEDTDIKYPHFCTYCETQIDNG